MAAASARKLAADGCATVADLLLAVPLRYEDRSHFARIADLRPGQAAVVQGRVAGSRLIRTRKRGFTILEAVIDDGSASIRAVWFNRPYLARAMEPGRRAILYGAAEEEARGLTFRNPEQELFEAEGPADPVHSGRVVGIYRRRGGLSGRWQRAAIAAALGALSPEFPAAGDSRALASALAEMHFPAGPDPASSAAGARQAIAREELLVFADLVEERRARRLALSVDPWRWDARVTRKLLSLLPFVLTAAQKAAIGEIAGDLKSGRPMARLLQGDVGSGKTAVAVLAALLCVENGRQAALMAPTEILAEQHAEKIGSWLAGTPYRLALLTGRSRASTRSQLLAALRAGQIDFLIGTHALIERPVGFQRLGLAIIDEQHRFGVRHRGRLTRKGERPHVLVLTATPIPRSLAWTLFGDLDVSRIGEKPPGRAPIRTYVRPESRRGPVYEFVGERVAAGERAYVVVPSIEQTGRDVAAVEDTAADISRRLPAARVAALHGRMKGEKRREVMGGFARGQIDVLVATTVIEVGIDVPEATVMVVENAERFGLAQLHQLRGRVGRGPAASTCILLTSETASEDSRERLEILEQTADGFEIAEKDLSLRGPGDLLGLRQAGAPDFRVARLETDLALLADARTEAAGRRAQGERIESALFPARRVIKPARPGTGGGDP